MLVELENRLRIAGPALSPEEAVETRRAIDKARWALPVAQLPALVWWLFVEAMDTQRRMPCSNGNGLSRWPPVFHTPAEWWEAELQRLMDIKISKEEPPLPRFAITDRSAIDRYLLVMGWTRYIKGKNRPRDVAVFLDLAALKPPRVVKRHFPWHCADSTVKMTKQRCLQQICVAIGPHAKC